MDLSDLFQRRWYLRQVLLYGREEDISQLNLEEIAASWSALRLPEPVASLWRDFLEYKGYVVR